MAFVQNFPFFCIIMTLFSGPLSSILGGKAARRLNLAVITLVGAMNTAVLAFVLKNGTYYVYKMGHFPAPWGNEIRVRCARSGHGSLFLSDYAALHARRHAGAGAGNRGVQAESLLYYGESSAVFPSGADLYE